VDSNQNQQQPTTSPEIDKPEKKRRFQIVKLEERIAPKKGTSHRGCSSASSGTESAISGSGAY
jgi:hypothetical protein